MRAGVADNSAEKTASIITTHDAFGYFGEAYGFELHRAAGLLDRFGALGARRGAADRADPARKGPRVFLENISDPRLMKRIAQESGAKIGGDLFSDSLSPADGPAATYIAMMEHNIVELKKALVPHS